LKLQEEMQNTKLSKKERKMLIKLNDYSYLPTQSKLFKEPSLKAIDFGRQS